MAPPREPSRGAPARIGRPIREGHASYAMTRAIKLGVAHTVAQAACDAPRPLALSDFAAELRVRFPAEGSRRTPPHGGEEFVLRDYAPLAFRQIREHFGVTAAEYVLSVAGEHPLRELGAPGKSGSVFYLTHDARYMVKTVSRKECRFLRAALGRYYCYLLAHPSSLLPRFFGLVSLRLRAGGRGARPGSSAGRERDKVRLLLMNNLLPDCYAFERYDLKGSSLGRQASAAERADPFGVRKDRDFAERLRVPEDLRALLSSQLQADCAWLESLHVMDYSLLVGLHWPARDGRERRDSAARARRPPRSPRSGGASPLDGASAAHAPRCPLSPPSSDDDGADEARAPGGRGLYGIDGVAAPRPDADLARRLRPWPRVHAAEAAFRQPRRARHAAAAARAEPAAAARLGDGGAGLAAGGVDDGSDAHSAAHSAEGTCASAASGATPSGGATPPGGGATPSRRAARASAGSSAAAQPRTEPPSGGSESDDEAEAAAAARRARGAAAVFDDSDDAWDGAASDGELDHLERALAAAHLPSAAAPRRASALPTAAAAALNLSPRRAKDGAVAAAAAAAAATRGGAAAGCAGCGCSRLLSVPLPGGPLGAAPRAPSPSEPSADSDDSEGGVGGGALLFGRGLRSMPTMPAIFRPASSESAAADCAGGGSGGGAGAGGAGADARGHRRCQSGGGGGGGGGACAAEASRKQTPPFARAMSVTSTRANKSAFALPASSGAPVEVTPPTREQLDAAFAASARAARRRASGAGSEGGAAPGLGGGGADVSTFKADDGGFRCVSVRGGEVEGVRVYIGIIDILQQYTRLKQMEHAYKAARWASEKEGISVVSPDKYAARFRSFILNKFQPLSSSTSARAPALGAAAAGATTAGAEHTIARARSFAVEPLHVSQRAVSELSGRAPTALGADDGARAAAAGSSSDEEPQGGGGAGGARARLPRSPRGPPSPRTSSPAGRVASAHGDAAAARPPTRPGAGAPLPVRRRSSGADSANSREAATGEQ